MSSNTADTAKILIVDDVEMNRFTLRDIIKDMGYQPILTENGEQALKIVERFSVSLIILDVAMPGMDGFEVCKILRENIKTRDIPIIFISAFDEPEDIVKGFEIGGSDYVTKPFVPEVVRARVSMHMKLHEAALEMVDMTRRLQVSVNEQIKRVQKEKKNVLYALLRVAKENAAYDDGHMDRISKNCRTLAEALQLTLDFSDQISDQYVDTIELAAPICDLGNVAVPTEILQKQNKLTDEEMKVMRRHTTVGQQILDDVDSQDSNNDFVAMSKEIALSHHENWDGSGYPNGISGNDIPLAAQIVAIISSYCALTEKRSYRDALPVEEAFKIIESEAGVKFNPVIYDVLFKIKRQLI